MGLVKFLPPHVGIAADIVIMLVLFKQAYYWYFMSTVFLFSLHDTI